MTPGTVDPLRRPVPRYTQDEASDTTRPARRPGSRKPAYISPTKRLSGQSVGGDPQVLPVTFSGLPFPLSGSCCASR